MWAHSHISLCYCNINPIHLLVSHQRPNFKVNNRVHLTISTNHYFNCICSPISHRISFFPHSLFFSQTVWNCKFFSHFFFFSIAQLEKCWYRNSAMSAVTGQITKDWESVMSLGPWLWHVCFRLSGQNFDAYRTMQQVIQRQTTESILVSYLRVCGRDGQLCTLRTADINLNSPPSLSHYT